VLVLWCGYVAFAVVMGLLFVAANLLYSFAMKQLAFLWWLIRPW
jgi:hypothetical protein